MGSDLAVFAGVGRFSTGAGDCDDLAGADLCDDLAVARVCDNCFCSCRCRGRTSVIVISGSDSHSLAVATAASFLIAGSASLSIAGSALLSIGGSDSFSLAGSGARGTELTIRIRGAFAAEAAFLAVLAFRRSFGAVEVGAGVVDALEVGQGVADARELPGATSLILNGVAAGARDDPATVLGVETTLRAAWEDFCRLDRRRTAGSSSETVSGWVKALLRTMSSEANLTRRVRFLGEPGWRRIEALTQAIQRLQLSR